MLKKILITTGSILAIIVLGFGIYLYSLKVRIERGDLVKWDNQWYTKEEIKQKFPPQYVDAPAKNTPEEVYTKFRAALLNGDTETALGLMTTESRQDYREAFKDREKFDKWIITLPEKITKENIQGNFASYDVDYGTSNKNTARFEKNSDGLWEISGI